jgi:hypothetical protein
MLTAVDDGRDRWEGLFADLESQWEAAERAEADADVEQRTWEALIRSPLVDRLRAARGLEVPLSLVAVGALRATLRDCGPDWVLVAPASSGPLFVPAGALLWVGDLGPDAVPDELEGQVARRWTFRLALRGLVENREEVRLVLTDGTVLEGTLARVGADYVEIALHPRGEPPRVRSVTGLRLVPLRAVAAVRT